MNSHNPFNTGGGCGPTDFSSRDQLVDRLIGDSYKIVKEVYLRLGQLEYFYNFLNRYGWIAPVDSDAALKELDVKQVKYARVYGKLAVGNSPYYFLDYLYVEGVLSGILPNVTNPTGSWIAVGSSGSGSNSLNQVWYYTATEEGQTTIKVPDDTPVTGVQVLYVEGQRQDINKGFGFDPNTGIITLADELSVGEEVTVILGLYDPENDLDIFSILAASDGASKIGTASGSTVQAELDGKADSVTLASTVGASAIGTYSGETVEKLLGASVYTVPSVTALATLNGVDGRIVKTVSYYAGGNVGGGYYYYDQSKVTLHDGVTNFNGWVRLFGKVRYASDAGILSDMASDTATAKLNTLFATAVEGCVFDLENLTINLSTHARLENVNDVVLQNYVLKGDRNNWSFVSADRGILLAIRCNRLEVHSGEVIGVRMSHPNAAMTSSITSTGRVQDGDSGMEFKYCDDLNVHHNKVHGVKTWGILSTNGTRPHVWKNTVYDCARQSGVSVCIGTVSDVEDASIHDNTIYNIGLYGVEVEKWTKVARRINVYANNIWDAQYGIHAVGLVRALNAYSNNVSGCRYGIAGTSLNASLGSEQNARNYFTDNILTANYAGIGSSNSYYATYKQNYINGLRSSDYFINDPYNTVEIVVSSNSFYSLRNLEVGLTISINGMICTVASSTAVTDTNVTEKIGLTTVYLVVVDQLPAGLQDYTPFKIQSSNNPTYSYGYWPFYQANYSEQVIENTFANVRYGLYQTAVATSNNGCFAVGNTFINVTVPIAGATYGIEVHKSKLQDCTRYTDSTGKLNYNQLGLRQLATISQPTPVTSSGTKPTVNFYNYSKDIAVRARVRVNNINWTGGNSAINLAVTLNGIVVGYINVTSLGSSVDSLVDFVNNGTLLAGVNTMRIVDTTGSLSFDSWYVDLFVAD